MKFLAKSILTIVFIKLVLNLSYCSQINEEISEINVNKNDGKLSKFWVMKLNETNIDEAKKIAKSHHFKILRQVGSLSGYYLVTSEHHRRRRSSDTTLTQFIKKSEEKLAAHPAVESFEREKLLVRKKRDFIEMPISSDIDLGTKFIRSSILDLKDNANRNSNANNGDIIDPLWNDMWYLNRNLRDASLPDMNVSGAWSQGYSGRGVAVTFLDDGLERDHPDIAQNYDPKASTDINGNDDDPTPRYEETNENKHGTRCAGEVAAVANNSICSVGVAYNAWIGGIRMLDGDVTDSVEASSLSHNSDHISIYSASWGPDDNGEVVDGPGALTKKAFIEGATKGRNGLGSIFVWASGNGGRFNDSCACDGYANSIYTISISSTSEHNEKPWYLEECTSTLATTYSSGNERAGEHEIVTTDINHKCTSKHTGTSAAAPLAAGIIALALEANPKLTWRDVMYLTVLSSRPKAIKSNNYIMNKRGLLVSSRYGFGLMDAGKMVEFAKNWVNVPGLQSCPTLNSNFKLRTNQKKGSIEAFLVTDACKSTINEVNYIEQVELIVTIRAPVRGMIEIYLTSPMGTRSLILPQRARDTSSDGFKKWTFMTVQLWGEHPVGEWKLEVISKDGSEVFLDDFNLQIHGTRQAPLDYDKYVKNSNQINKEEMIKSEENQRNQDKEQEDELSIPIRDRLFNMCNFECSPIGMKCGPTEFDCQICAHYSLEIQPDKIKCVSYCPPGYFADDIQKKCVKCHSDCIECNGPSRLNCTTCLNLLKPDTNECVSSCDDGYFQDNMGKCQKCDENCLTCEFTSNYCTSCFTQDNLPDSGRPEFILRNNVCILKRTDICENGTYYEPSINDCQFCDIDCTECKSNSMSDCLKCTKRRPFLKDGNCVSQCGPGYYLEPRANICLECPQNCDSCQNNKICSSCKPGFNLNNEQQCVILISRNEECQDTNCYECYKSSNNQCLTCKNGYSLLNGKCLKDAPEGYFLKTLKDIRGLKSVFQKCKPFCKTCENEDVCLKCDENFKTINHKCYAYCENKYYSGEDGTCIPCQAPCETCSNSTTCLTCLDNKYFFEGKCLDKCPTSYYSENFKCYKCYPSCDSCKGPKKTDCLSCSRGFVSKNDECISTCPEGTYFDNLLNECVVCDSSKCSECVSSATQCTKCFSPLSLDVDSFTCKPCCGRAIYGKTMTNSCCNCPNKYNGYCSKATKDETFNMSPNKNGISFRLIFFCLFVLVSILVLIISIKYVLSCTRKSREKYDTVVYMALNEST